MSYEWFSKTTYAEQNQTSIENKHVLKYKHVLEKNTFDRIVKLRNHVNHILTGNKLKHPITCNDAKTVVFGQVPVQNLRIRAHTDFFRYVITCGCRVMRYIESKVEGKMMVGE